MKTSISAIAIVSCIAVATLWNSAAYARSPDATHTPTATATTTSTPTPTPWPTATPTLPREQVAEFSGDAWLPAFGGYDRVAVVTAKIGDTVCGDDVFLCDTPGPCLHPPIDPSPDMLPYHLDVVPAEEEPGCGYEGAPITFFVGDKQAEQSAVWRAGASQEVNLSAGPPFALFQGKFTFAFEPAERIGVDKPAGMIALVGNNVCGQAINGIWRGRDGQGRDVYWYSVLVYSNEQQQGCGVEGDEVVLRLIWNREPGNVNVGEAVAVAKEKGVWHAWDGMPPELNLTMVPIGSITLGNVGDGGSQRSDAAFWAELSLGLSAMGALGIAAAVALRRRAARR